MDPIQILEKVHAFYAESFSHLLILTIAVLTFAGVVLPIIVQMIQSRTFRNEQTALEGQIDLAISDKAKQLEATVEQKFSAAKDDFDKTVKAAFADLQEKLGEQILAT